jgi:hypothetical protein
VQYALASSQTHVCLCSHIGMIGILPGQFSSATWFTLLCLQIHR